MGVYFEITKKTRGQHDRHTVAWDTRWLVYLTPNSGKYRTSAAPLGRIEIGVLACELASFCF
jgi:hypothetical protein